MDYLVQKAIHFSAKIPVLVRTHLASTDLSAIYKEKTAWECHCNNTARMLPQGEERMLKYI